MIKLHRAFWLLTACLTGPLRAEHNVVTPAEHASEYYSMFNGTDLHGWKSWNRPYPPEEWEAVPESTWGVLNIKTPKPGDDGHLLSLDIIQNFDIKLEWAVPPLGRSGVSVRYLAHPSNDKNSPFASAFGPMAPVIDDYASDAHNWSHAAGDCYEMYQVDSTRRHWDFPSSVDGQGHPVYRYNQFRIIAYGRHVAQYGNGRKLLEFVIGSEDWQNRFKKSSLLGYELYGDIHAGSFFLQNQGTAGVRYRDLRFKNLRDEEGMNPWALGSPYLNNPQDTASGLKDVFTFDDNLVFGSAATRLPARRERPSLSNTNVTAFDMLGRLWVPALGRPALLVTTRAQ